MNIAVAIQLVTDAVAAGVLIKVSRDRRRNHRHGETVTSRMIRKSKLGAEAHAAYELRHIRPEYAESMAWRSTVVHETVRDDAGPCTGMGALVGHVRLHRTAHGVYLVKSLLGLSSLPTRTWSTDWSGWATEAEGVTAYYDALDSWYRRDDHTDLASYPNSTSAHEAPIDHGHDLVAVHAALTADLDPADLDLTVGSLPARILHAASTAGYDATEIRALVLTDEDLLPGLVVAAALNPSTRNDVTDAGGL